MYIKLWWALKGHHCRLVFWNVHMNIIITWQRILFIHINYSKVDLVKFSAVAGLVQIFFCFVPRTSLWIPSIAIPFPMPLQILLTRVPNLLQMQVQQTASLYLSNCTVNTNILEWTRDLSLTIKSIVWAVPLALSLTWAILITLSLAKALCYGECLCVTTQCLCYYFKYSIETSSMPFGWVIIWGHCLKILIISNQKKSHVGCLSSWLKKRLRHGLNLTEITPLFQ